MNITEIRYKNARYLADSVGGINAVAEKMGKSQPQVSYLLADKPVKNIGNKIARQFSINPKIGSTIPTLNYGVKLLLTITK